MILQNLLFQEDTLQHFFIGNFHVTLKGGSLGRINIENVYEWPPGEKKTRVDFNLKDIQLECDCNLVDFMEVFSDETREVRRFINFQDNNVTCKNPPLQNRLIRNITTNDLFCIQSDCAGNCTCFDQPHKNFLVMNCSDKNFSNIDYEFLKSFNNTNKRRIKLDLSHNNLMATPNLNEILEDDKVSFLSSVIHLDLSFNNINELTPNVLYNNLEELNLHNNLLSRLEEEVLNNLKINKKSLELTLRDNQWTCNCDTFSLIDFIKNSDKVKDKTEIKCTGSNKDSLTTHNEFNLCWFMRLITAMVVLIFITISAILVAYYYKNKKKIKIWLYSREWCLWFVTEDDLDDDKEYDAFISYSHKDENFVMKEIVEKLENGPKSYKLCLHHRDWLAGELQICIVKF